jgi:phenylpropionate dioxygenase-like ring-hydroxylating dioxygenase large terminal subunit
MMQTSLSTPTVIRDQSESLPAGGLDEQRFNWAEVWYPVAYLSDLNKAQPTRFTLLEQDLVIWWDGIAETWRVFDDRCPHRLAPLSEGRIAEDGLLECPYHGWAFKGTGECDRIPQQPDGTTAETSKRACVKAYPATVRQGMLFVYPGTAELSDRVPVPVIEPLEDGSDDWTYIDTFRDLPYDALTLMENVLDSSHVPFTHHKSMANRETAGPVNLEVLEFGRQGLRGQWEEGPRQGKLGKQYTTFIAPGLMWHDLTAKQFGRTLTAVYATPIRKGECRVFARLPFKFSAKLPRFIIGITPRWYSHLGQNGLLEDDQIFLHYQERYLAQSGGHDEVARAFYLPTKADTYVLKLHQWVSQFNARPFGEQSLSDPLPNEQLLDRYHSHVKHCNSCRTALKNIQKARLLLALVAIAGWTILPALAVLIGQSAPWAIALGTVVVAIAAGSWFGLGRLEEKFYRGREIPPRNRPE